MRKILRDWWLPSLLFGGVFATWFWWRSHAPGGVEESLSIAEAGQHGDWFGSLNALFSGLAFAGLIITLRMQREELQLQRRDLELNTSALREQKDEMARTARALQGQLAMMNKSARLACLPILIGQVEARINGNSSRPFRDSISTLSDDELMAANDRATIEMALAEDSVANLKSWLKDAAAEASESMGRVRNLKKFEGERIRLERLAQDLQLLVTYRYELECLYHDTGPVTDSAADDPMPPQ